jgi:hypothetical protein
MSIKRPSYFLRIVFLVDSFKGIYLFKEYAKHDLANVLIDSFVLNIPKKHPASDLPLNS